MKFKDRTLAQLADMICGNFDTQETFFRYRSSTYLTGFFQDCDTDYRHDGSTRGPWVARTLAEILAEPQPNANTPPDSFARVIRVLMDQSDAVNEEASQATSLRTPEHRLGSRGVRSVLRARPPMLSAAYRVEDCRNFVTEPSSPNGSNLAATRRTRDAARDSSYSASVVFGGSNPRARA
jgi:hypothetical protein